MRRNPHTLVVNSGTAEPIRVNLRTVVNNADIRTVTEDGREYLVIPSYTLPDGVVMNGGLYLKEEIDKSYASLEDTPAPVGHPMANGKYISAYHPKATNAYYAGAFNRNVRREGNRVYLEKWVDTAFAATNERGQELLEAVNKKQPIHTSTGILLEQEPVTNADGYKWIARNMRFDHDAILINETGAATPDQGVGLMVNVADATAVTMNEDVLGDSYQQKRDALSEALRAKYGQGDAWVYAEDFDGVNVIYCVDDDYFTTAYSYVDGKVTLSEQSQPVERKTEFSLKATVNKILTLLRGGVVSKPETVTPNTEALDMTPEELKAALDAQLLAMNAATAEAIAPLTAQIAELKTANADLSAKLTANTTAQETEMRTVVTEHLGEVVANALSGDALKAAFVKFVPAAPLVGGMPRVNTKDGFDELPE